MTGPRMTTVVTALAILASPAFAFAQSGGASAGGAAAGGGSPPPGTNSAGTAQSSGAGVNTGAGVTTGAAGTGTSPRQQGDTDAAIAEENRTIDRKLKGICRGC